MIPDKSSNEIDIKKGGKYVSGKREILKETS